MIQPTNQVFLTIFLIWCITFLFMSNIYGNTAQSTSNDFVRHKLAEKSLEKYTLMLEKNITVNLNGSKLTLS